MRFPLRTIAGLIFLAFAATLSAQQDCSATVTTNCIVYPPGTGAAHQVIGGIDLDDNWSIILQSGMPEEAVPDLPEAAARIVNLTQQGGSWFLTTIGRWIGPAANQSNASRPPSCCGGTVVYELDFNVNSPNQKFDMTVYADDTVKVWMNNIDNVIAFNGADPTNNTPGIATVTKGFQAGNNKLFFLVTNINGPTGLYVKFGPASAATTTSKYGEDTAPAPRAYRAGDPVDVGTGQYYENDSDFELGGAMSLGFRRYYSSQLNDGKISTSLGTNWMSNFDAFASVVGTNAQVLLPGGKIVSFANSGGAWQLVAPKDIVYQFIQNGTSSQLLDPRGNYIYSFSSAGTLASIADRNGNTLAVTQGANGPTQVSDGHGRTLTFTYTGANLTKVTDQAARSVSYAYTGGLLASTTNTFNQTTKYTYTTVGTATGLMTTKQLPLGNNPFSQTFDAQGRVLTQRIVPGTDGTAYTTAISYDANGTTTVTDGLGKVTKFVNNAAGNTLQFSDPTSATAIITFDGSERRTSITDKLGNKTNYTSHPQTGFLSSLTDALGNTTSITYTSQASGGFTFYDLSGITYPDGTSVTRTFDSNGNVLTETGRNGAVTKFTYDSSGRILNLTKANLGVSTYTWNADSTMSSITDALGNKRTFAYDNTKRMTSSVNPNGGSTAYNLDKSTTGPMVAINPPVSGESVAIYDDQNRQLQDVVNSIGGVYHSNYTATGQLADYTDPLKHKTTYAYDGDDRLSTVTNSAGEKATYAYDTASRVASVSDANGPRLFYTYTTDSRLATLTDGAGHKASYSYDAAGQLTTVTTPAGRIYKNGYDKLGNVTSMTNPLGEVTSLTLDAAGAVKSVLLPGGITTSATRNANEAITSMTSANGNTWTLGRDANQRLSKVTDPLGQSTSLTYTGNRITQVTLPLGTLAVTSDADGRVTKQQFSDGTTFSNTYDANGALIATDGVTIKRDSMVQATNINGIAITNDGEGRPLTLTYATGKTVTYGYDTSGLLTSITDWVGGKTTLNYDAAGSLTSFTYPNGVTTTNSYDADGNLLKITAGSLASIALTRDAVGKITAADRNLPIAPVLAPSSQQLSYDAAGQLTSATYDTMGRVTSQNGRTYTWNLASQLTAFKDGVNSATLTYDGVGEINSSSVTGATQNFVFNYSFDLPTLSIVRQASADVRYYVYLPNGTLLYSVEASDNSRHFYHFDEMGNTAFLTSDKGTVTDSYAITPYGEVAAHIGTAENPFVWQGQFGVMQVGQNLYYVRNRYYDATTARFISRDPELALNPLVSEPYAYGGGNPMLYIDPYGSGPLDWLGGIVSKALTVVKTVYDGGAALVTKVIETGKELFQTSTPAAAPKKTTPPAKQPIVASKLKPATTVPFNETTPSLGDFAPSTPDAAPTCRKNDACVGGTPVPAGSLARSLHLGTDGTLYGPGGQIIGHDGAGIIGHDGAGIIGHDGAGIIGHDGAGFQDGDTVLVDRVAYVVANDGGTLISQDGNNFTISVPLIGNAGGAVLGLNPSSLMGNIQSNLVSDNGSLAVAQGGGN